MSLIPDQYEYIYSPSYWLPPICYYASLAELSKPLIIEGHENYQKRSFRNRGEILTTNGRIRLSVPLKKGKNQRTPITHVTLDDNQSWKRNHLRTIMSAYGSAPFYDYFMPMIEELYKQECTRLFEWNLNWQKFLFQALQLDLDWKVSESFLKFRTKEHISLELEEDENICSSLQFDPAFWYPQVFSDRFDFMPDLSPLDILFCTGPEAAIIIQQYWKTPQ